MTANTTGGDFNGSRDSWMRENTATTNYGTDAVNYAQGFNTGQFARIMCGWDMPSGLTGATITAVTLELYGDSGGSSGGAGGIGISAHKMLVDFVEAEATWNKRNTSTDWTTAGAGS